MINFGDFIKNGLNADTPQSMTISQSYGDNPSLIETIDASCVELPEGLPVIQAAGTPSAITATAPKPNESQSFAQPADQMEKSAKVAETVAETANKAKPMFEQTAGQPPGPNLEPLTMAKQAETTAINAHLGHQNALKRLKIHQLEDQAVVAVAAIQHTLYSYSPSGSLDVGPPPPEVPINAFPELFRRLVLEISDGNPIRLMLAFAALIGLIPATTQGTYTIQCANGNNHQYIFTAYVFGSASSGSGKSAVLDELLRPFVEHEEEMAVWGSDETNPLEKTFATLAVKTFEKQARKFLDVNVYDDYSLECKKKDIMPTIETIQVLKNEIARQPIIYKLLAGNLTMTKLPFALGEAGRHEYILLADAEGSILRQINARNADILLKAFEGKRHEHKTRADSVSLKSPVIGMVQFMQDSKFRDLRDKKDIQTIGLFARSLCAIAPDDPLFDSIPVSTVSESTWNHYNSLMQGLLKTATAKKRRGESRTVIKMSSEADYASKNWYRDFRTRAGKVSDEYNSFLVRTPQHLAIVALVLHLMDGASDDQEISVATIYRAVPIIEFFSYYGKMILDQSTFNEKINAEKILAWLVEEQVEVFRARDAQREACGQPPIDDVKAALVILEKANYVRRCNVRERGACARKGLIWIVNPRLVPGFWVPLNPFVVPPYA